MTYDFNYLYNEFQALAGMRKGNPAYDNDSTYWDGGHCNWGGNHNLREDVQTIAGGFEKLESLEAQKIIAELNKCTSQQEYESKKQNYLRKANELESGLQVRTGYSSSMFGICIIWADDNMKVHVESKLGECRRSLEQLKSQLGMEKYQYIEELRLLKLEEKQIEARMRENKRKAEREKDPSKKAALLLLIEEDGKRLEENLRKQKAIPTSKINFNPREHVERIMEGIRRGLGGVWGKVQVVVVLVELEEVVQEEIGENLMNRIHLEEEIDLIQTMGMFQVEHQEAEVLIKQNQGIISNWF